jgi:hypothetical protein
MNTSKQTKRGGYKRSQVKKPSLHSYAKPGLLTTLSPIATPAALTLTPAIMPVPQPEKSFGDLLSELVWEAAKSAWKQTDPASYNLNQAMFELAPYCPPESRWILGVGAIGSAIYGLGQVADRFDKTIKRERNRR